MKRLTALMLSIAFAVCIGIAFGNVPPQQCCRWFSGCQHNCDKQTYKPLNSSTTKTSYIWSTALKGSLHSCINADNAGDVPPGGGTCFDDPQGHVQCASINAYDNLGQCQAKENTNDQGQTNHVNCTEHSTECLGTNGNNPLTTQPFVYPASQ